MMPLIKISEEQEAEFRVMIARLYKDEGVIGVLACISTVQKIQVIFLTKLNELIEEDKKNEPLS